MFTRIALDDGRYALSGYVLKMTDSRPPLFWNDASGFTEKWSDATIFHSRAGAESHRLTMTAPWAFQVAKLIIEIEP